MFNAEIQVEEDISLIEDLIIIDSESIVDKRMLVPDNRAEIIVPLTVGVKVKPVGHSRDVSLSHHTGYFLMPRGRGLEIKCHNERIGCLIIKVNPIYAKKIATSLNEISNGIFEMTLDKWFIDELRISQENENYLKLKELVSDDLAFSLNGGDSISTTILDSIEQIKYSSGAITIKEIYSSLCVSKSKLEQHFNREIGLTPKEFCKIEKINYFIRSYKEQVGKSLTELTYECGYYDQSHLIKDFRYFMDISPKQYFEGLNR